MDLLIEYNGGFERFTRGAGIYVITFLPGERDLKYVGASSSVRNRLKAHLKNQLVPAWAHHLAKKLYIEEFKSAEEFSAELDFPFEIYSTKDFHNMEAFARNNCDAEVIETFGKQISDREIQAAEDQWIAKLKPQLNSKRRSKGGYKTNRKR